MPRVQTENDGSTAYYLGNAALILTALIGVVVLCYTIVTPYPAVRLTVFFAVGVPLIGYTLITLYQGVRRRYPTRDVAVIMSTAAPGDERQRHLRARAGSLAGSCAVTFSVVAGLILTTWAELAGVTIDTSGEWSGLGVTVAYGPLLVYHMALAVAARHYSRKG